MTQDEIIEMAVKAGIAQAIAEVNIDIMEAFAKLIAEKEREACAKLCEDDDSNAGEWHWEAHVGGYFARAIKERKNHEK